MRYILCLILHASTFAFCMGQEYLGNHFYFVEFTDKIGTDYSVDRPNEYLSQRAIDRRVKCNIPIDESDLPVNEKYVKAVEETGATIWGCSKWRNGVVVKVIATDEMTLQDWFAEIAKLKCVKHKAQSVVNNSQIGEPMNMKTNHALSIVNSESNYGKSFDQIKQINCDYLHNNGYRGQDMVIAVLDAGFLRANIHTMLKPLWDNEQIIGVQDIVNPFDSNVFIEDGHGTAVLSFMGANVEGQLVGSAPDAKYWLIRTEDNSEGVDNLSEEYFWLMGAELADRVGADIINSSLGYNHFAEEYMSYTYEDMNGRIAISTLAAEKAIAKGILVVCSAGNEGNKVWKHITAPSDGQNVLAVGAVNLKGEIAAFSSIGPSADGRVKPDVVAGGDGVFYANPYNESNVSSIAIGGGTSFSGPLLAGAVASLWSSDKSLTNMDILNIVRQSATLYNSPDASFGYGLANMKAALSHTNSTTPIKEFDQPKIYPNPVVASQFTINNLQLNDDDIIEIYDINGQKQSNVRLSTSGGAYSSYIVNCELKNGLYILRIISNNKTYTSKFIKK